MALAQSRGEIRPDADLEAVVGQLWGACYQRLLLPARPVTHAFADALLDNVFGGIAAPAAGPGRRARTPG